MNKFVYGLIVGFFLGMLLASPPHAKGQVGIGSAQQAPTQPTYTVPDHPQHADQGTPRPEVSLLGNNAVTYAQGERPLWEFGSDKVEPSLGDVARAYRKEHAVAEKAVRVWNQ